MTTALGFGSTLSKMFNRTCKNRDPELSLQIIDITFNTQSPKNKGLGDSQLNSRLIKNWKNKVFTDKKHKKIFDEMEKDDYNFLIRTLEEIEDRSGWLVKKVTVKCSNNLGWIVPTIIDDSFYSSGLAYTPDIWEREIHLKTDDLSAEPIFHKSIVTSFPRLYDRSEV